MLLSLLPTTNLASKRCGQVPVTVPSFPATTSSMTNQGRPLILTRIISCFLAHARTYTHVLPLLTQGNIEAWRRHRTCVPAQETWSAHQHAATLERMPRFVFQHTQRRPSEFWTFCTLTIPTICFAVSSRSSISFVPHCRASSCVTAAE